MPPDRQVCQAGCFARDVESAPCQLRRDCHCRCRSEKRDRRPSLRRGFPRSGEPKSWSRDSVDEAYGRRPARDLLPDHDTVLSARCLTRNLSIGDVRRARQALRRDTRRAHPGNRRRDRASADSAPNIQPCSLFFDWQDRGRRKKLFDLPCSDRNLDLAILTLVPPIATDSDAGSGIIGTMPLALPSHSSRNEMRTACGAQDRGSYSPRARSEMQRCRAAASSDGSWSTRTPSSRLHVGGILLGFRLTVSRPFRPFSRKSSATGRQPARHCGYRSTERMRSGRLPRFSMKARASLSVSNVV